MSHTWRFFLIIEGLLLLFAAWQIFHQPLLSLFLLSGLCLCFLGYRTAKPKKTMQLLGALLTILALLNSSAIWLMLLFTILFIGVKGVELSGIQLFQKTNFQKKKMVIVETIEPTTHQPTKKKILWLGDERIGKEIFEWDDIIINNLAGDTIIDLGNTLLPKQDNIVMIRKGFGKLRILVPSGIGIHLQQQTVLGTARFEEQELELRNEEISLYSKEYDASQRRLKIISTTLIGDVEVIRV